MIFQMKEVSKRLGNFRLQDISIELPEGYIMGLIGENGAGKTSLLHLLLGLYQPDKGELTVFDEKYKEQEKEIKNDIGYVLLDDLFCRNMTLLNNAKMYGKYYEKFDLQVFSDYCTRFELEEQKTLKKLSKGQKLKFQFAFALSHQPKLLILDEPTANFDPEFREQFLHIITDFVKDGKHSVLLATHLTSDLDRIADYLTLIHKGKLLFSMDRESLFRQYRMVSGEDYKVNLLPKENILYKEKSSFSSKALVRHGRWSRYDSSLSVWVPSTEELMYYMLKGGTYA